MAGELFVAGERVEWRSPTRQEVRAALIGKLAGAGATQVEEFDVAGELLVQAQETLARACVTSHTPRELDALADKSPSLYTRLVAEIDAELPDVDQFDRERFTWRKPKRLDVRTYMVANTAAVAAFHKRDWTGGATRQVDAFERLARDMCEVRNLDELEDQGQYGLLFAIGAAIAAEIGADEAPDGARGKA